MKSKLLGRGYYTLDRLKRRRATMETELNRLDKMISATKRLTVQRDHMRREKYQKRDRKIHQLRGKGYTLVEIGDLFGITKNRVSQIIHTNGHS